MPAQPDIERLAALAAEAQDSLIRFTEITHGKYVVRDFHRVVAAHLEDVERAVTIGKRKKLMIFTPPRRGKSELASVRLPAWFLGRNPDKQIIQASYNQALADKFSRQARGVIRSKRYGLIFPRVKISDDVASVREWEVQSGGDRGIYRAAGAGAGITGVGADMLLIDDPIKDAEEAKSEAVQESRYDWYISTARTRLMPGASEVIIMTRWHQMDLAGRLLEEENDWEVVTIPFRWEGNGIDPLGREVGEFIDDGRFTQAECQKTWDDLGGTPLKRFVRNSLYQQDPVPVDSMPFQGFRENELVLESPELQDYNIYPIFDAAQSKGKRRDATGVIVGGINAVHERAIVYAAEIREKPSARNKEIMTIMRRIERATGHRKLWVEGDEDMLHSLNMTFREHGENFIVEKLAPRGRNKESRIEEIDNYVHTISVGPEAQKFSERMRQWSRVSGTPDDVPDAGAYFCEVAKYIPLNVSEIDPKPAPGTLERRILDRIEQPKGADEWAMA